MANSGIIAAVLCHTRKVIMMKPTTVRLMTLPAAVLVLTLSGCGSGKDGETPPAPPAKQVEALTIQPRPLALASELPGRVEPIRVAEVRARVAGIVLKRNFTEGETVKAGQVLFQIDPAPFKVMLSRARSELARAEAQLTDAQSVSKRYASLVEVDAISQQDFDAARATLDSAKAAREGALSEIETARLNLGYATVTAPISGRIGRALVTEGALVGQNEATPLATIQQIDQVYVDFKQPVAQALNLRAAIAGGKLSRDGEKAAGISLTVDGTDQRREGKLLFSDIGVDRNTGQVSLRGQFANADGLLLPGMYVRVHTPLAVDANAVLVPQRAVQRGVDGKPFVITVGQDSTAQARTVMTGATEGSDWQITEGLKAGDKVVINGQVVPGEKVTLVAPARPVAAAPVPAAAPK